MDNSELLSGILKDRRSVRQFSKSSVSDEDIVHILRAGCWAPSSLNLQPWMFIVVKDENAIRALWDAAYYSQSSDAHLPGVMIACVLSKDAIHKSALRGSFEKRFMPYLNYINIGMPAFAMALQATALNIAACIQSPTLAVTKKILKIPDGHECPLIVALGYEHPQAVRASRDRKEIKGMVFSETFGRKASKLKLGIKA